MTGSAKTLRVVVSGRVQGVGFRYWTQDVAMGLGLSGWVRNRRDGGVEALISGPRPVVNEMLARFWQGPRAARVEGVSAEETDDDAPAAFEIRPTV